MPKEDFEKVRGFITSIGPVIVEEDEEEELFVIEDEERGIKNMIIDCEDPILVIEQPIIPVPSREREAFYGWLLRKNRELVHGAFCLDEEHDIILFRDTLRLSTLDQEELEASINALAMALAENLDDFLKFGRGSEF